MRVKTISIKKFKKLQNECKFWKEGIEDKVIEMMGFKLEENIGYFPAGRSFIFKDYPMGELRYWCISQDYFEKKHD